MSTAAPPRRQTRRNRQMRYLSQAVQLEEAVNPRVVGITMSVVSLAILAFIVWAAFTDINEVARTTGEVVPQGFQQSVQHLEGGIVKAIEVEEGDIVEQGDVLLVLDDAVIRDDLESAEVRHLALGMEAERLRAFVDSREPDFSGFLNVSTQTLHDNLAFFSGMRAARNEEKEVLGDQLEQRRRQIEALRGDLAVAEANLILVTEVFDRRSRLNAKGYSSTMQLLEDQRRLNDVRGSVGRLTNQILVAEGEIAEFEHRFSSLIAKHRDNANDQLSKILAAIDQNSEALDKMKERIGRMTIRAPTRGLVKGFTVNTIGAVIRPGETLMEVVPIDKTLEVLVRISPRDVGHLAVGQPVQIKFSSFDFSRYGSISGELRQISATTFAEPNGSRYYQGRIRLDRNYVGRRTDNLILPGMTVTADIITGEKTILEYLLKPIHISLQTALTER